MRGATLEGYAVKIMVAIRRSRLRNLGHGPPHSVSKHLCDRVCGKSISLLGGIHAEFPDRKISVLKGDIERSQPMICDQCARYHRQTEPTFDKLQEQ
jgi:hypothetical protein